MKWIRLSTKQECANLNLRIMNMLNLGYDYHTGIEIDGFWYMPIHDYAINALSDDEKKRLSELPEQEIEI